jgi:GTP-binding protein YchF
MLADLDSLERRLPILEKKIRGQEKEAKKTLELVERVLPLLREGRPARLVEIEDDERAAFKALGLLTAKPVLYVCNVDEDAAATGNAYSARVEKRARAEGAGCVIISAKIEAELAELGPEERRVYLGELGLAEPGLNRLIREGYKLLDLITYFTAGPKEARAWTVPVGTRAPQAAGVIHTDFEKGFIRAETIAYDEYVALGGEAGARDAGKLRLEGKDYVVKDGDVLHFRFAN